MLVAAINVEPGTFLAIVAASAVAGTVSGSGSLVQAGPGTTTLTADNSYSGGTTISQGTLQIGNGGTSGSIVGNVLLVMGAAMLAGGIGRDKQIFNRTGAAIQTSMLMLAAAALIMPAIFELVEGQGLPLPGSESTHYGGTVEHLSLAVAVVLMITYALGLVFSLKTHRDLFNPDYEDEEGWGW